MKRRKTAKKYEALYSMKTFLELAYANGYALDEENAIPKEVHTFFIACLQDDLRNAVRAALLDADNKGKRTLTMDNAGAVIAFTKR